MSELMRSVPTPREQNASVRAARIAGEQWGVISWNQLRSCGVSSSTAGRWRAEGKLHAMHRGVYALGHGSVPIEGRLVAALIRAGPNAVLSHETAAWWWELIPQVPRRIHVSSVSRVAPVPQVLIHHPQHLMWTRYRRFPVTTVARTLVDYAATAPAHRLRRVLAEADYRGLLDTASIEGLLGRGRRGSKQLRIALKQHQPRLALTRSVLEERFLALCESAAIPLPEINATVEGLTVDALWRTERLIVELDGHANHRSAAQIRRDRDRELCLRAAGFLVIRYTWTQIIEAPETVITDLRATLEARSPLSFPAPSASPISR